MTPIISAKLESSQNGKVAANNDENVVTGKGAWDETYSDPILVPIGPVTRARAKKFKDALMGLIRATWSQTIRGGPLRELRR